MKRILILGCPGSGKSTASKKLSQKLNIPVIHLDRLFWREGWTNVSREEFDTLLEAELEKDEWIIDGNYSRTIPVRLERADTAVFFDYPTVTCFWRVIKRVITKHGVSRSDMENNCPERFDFEFLLYVARFRKSQRKMILGFLENSSADVIIVHNKKEYAEFENKFLK